MLIQCLLRISALLMHKINIITMNLYYYYSISCRGRLKFPSAIGNVYIFIIYYRGELFTKKIDYKHELFVCNLYELYIYR